MHRTFSTPQTFPEAAATEALLGQDPCGAYPAMDAPSRDRYLRAAQRIAMHARAGVDAVAVARAALRRAEAAAADPGARPAAAHVGDHLVGTGVRELEREVGYRPPPGARAGLFLRRHPLPVYLGACTLLAAAGVGGVAAYAARHGAGVLLMVLVGIVALPSVANIAKMVARFLMAGYFPPRVLPKMAFATGIPDEHRTLLVVPTLLRSADDARRQVARLGRLGSEHPDPNLRFALLSDFTDAPGQTMPGDQEILDAVGAALAELNGRSGDALGDRFFVLHRERLWNPDESCWMGWMRKPGKIEELNRALREPHAVTGFRWVFGDFARVAASARFRYVVTLDESDWFEAGAIVDMVRTAAHPLNRPRFDPRRGRVVEGYGVLQPLLMRMPPAVRTRYLAVITGSYGRDALPPEPIRKGPPPPTPHFYHDVFGEGQYYGRAIYDVDAFRSAMDGLLLPSVVPNHDFVESPALRAGTLNDVWVQEDVSARYVVETTVLYRWARGIWQLLPFVLPRVRDTRGRWRPTPFPPAFRLRLLGFANAPLARISVPTLLLLGLVILPGRPVVWVGIALFELWIQVAADGVRALGVALRRVLPGPSPRGPGGDGMMMAPRNPLVPRLVVSGLYATTLAHHAALAAGAIGRALWRLLLRTRRTEWVTHADSKGAGDDPASYLRRMWASPAAGFAAAVLVVATGDPVRVLLAAPFAVLWTAAPWIMWYLDRPLLAAGAGAVRGPAAQPVA